MKRLMSAVVLGVGSGFAWGQGTIGLSVDLRDAPKKVLHATETIPVTAAGAMVLAYPKWIPGEHGPTGPIDNQAGLVITATGANGQSAQPVKWERDPVEMYSYHVTVPAGATRLTVKMDYLAAPNGAQFSAGGSTSANLAVLSWNTLLVYPYTGASMDAKTVTVQPSITLPAGWHYGTALEPVGGGDPRPGDNVDFKAVNLEQLVDSPVLAGRFFREVELAPALASSTGGPKHYLDMAADGPEDVQVSPAHIDQFSKLIYETGALYRSRHYGAYHFLVTLSDQVAHFGLEHHQSSDDRVAPKTFTDDNQFVLNGLLLPHEFTHSWNGKYRRPAGLATPNYQVPMVGDLLWVYEGLTEYLGDVLAARSGIWTAEQYRDRLATYMAKYEYRPGRKWRDLQDTARMAQVLYNVGGPYDNYRLGTDFYDEGEMLWLDVDTTIREKTGGKKSLNDFVAAFHGLGGNTAPKVVPYTFEEVLAGLNAVVANDWAGFLHGWLDRTDGFSPTEGLVKGGWRLVYTDKPNPWLSMAGAQSGAAGAWFSLGLIATADGTAAEVLVDGPAYKAGMGPGMKIVAVNGRAFTAEVLRSAIKDSKGSQDAMELIVENTGFYKVLKVDYHDGERYPNVERVSGVPDRLGEITRPMVK